MKYIINHISEDIFLQKLAIIHYKEVLGHCFPGKRIRLNCSQTCPRGHIY